MTDAASLDRRFSHLGADLLVTPFFQATEWDQLDLQTRPRGPTTREDSVDLDLAAGAGCLQQALVLRLLTPQGSLSALAHPDYGSRLHLLIGEFNTPVTRARAKAYVLEALAQERRVAKVLDVTVSQPADGAQDRLLISASVLPAKGGDAVRLGLEVAL